MAEEIIGVDRRRRKSMPMEGVVKNPKNKFRALVRNVIYNLPWLTGRMKKSSAINESLRSLLLKRVAHRTQEELETIYHLLNNYKSFRKYPPEVEQKLASCMYYYYVPAGKIILRQGDPGYDMYFILTGECAVIIQSKDHYSDEIVECDPIILTHGTVFGEVALLHHIPRTATVRSETECELLRLSGDDFNDILKKNLEAEWNRIREALKLFPYFYYWTEIDIREFCILAVIKKYAPNEVILGTRSTDYNYSYFILSGTCQLIQSLPLIVSGKKGRKIFRVCLNDDEPLKSLERIEIVFLQVCVFYPGSTLSIGEDMKDRQIIATSEVSCLRCPRYWLIQYNRGNIWPRIARFLNSIYPSRKKLFERLMQDRKWSQFRKELVEPIYAQRAASNATSLHDVPMSIRIHEKINWNKPGFKIRRRKIRTAEEEEEGQ